MNPEIKDIHEMAVYEVDECRLLLMHCFANVTFQSNATIPAYEDWLYSSDFTETYEYFYRSLQLIGYNDNWTNWSSEPLATFNNLMYGSYTFELKAKKGDFRVQDDFGGTVEMINPSKDIIQLAEKTIKKLNPNLKLFVKHLHKIKLRKINPNLIIYIREPIRPSTHLLVSDWYKRIIQIMHS